MTEKSESGEWWTPDYIFRKLCDEHNILPDLDVAATEENSRCRFHFSKEDDALTRDWLIPCQTGEEICTPSSIWCNCPTKLSQKFMFKAYEQWTAYKMGILMILPANVMSSNGFWENIEIPRQTGQPISYSPIRGRINFLYKGKDVGNARNAYIEVFFKGNLRP